MEYVLLPPNQHGEEGRGGASCAPPPTNMGRRVVKEHVLLSHQLTFNFFHVYILIENNKVRWSLKYNKFRAKEL